MLHLQSDFNVFTPEIDDRGKLVIPGSKVRLRGGEAEVVHPIPDGEVEEIFEDKRAYLEAYQARKRPLIEAERAGWGEVAAWAERRGEVIVIAHGRPLTARLLREHIARWEARGLRVVPVSELVH